MDIAVTLDWLAFTFRERTRDSEDYINHFLRIDSGNPERPRNGYDTAFRTEDNVVVSWHSNRAEMGTHVVFAGSALRKFCERLSWSQIDTLEVACGSGGTVSRLDIAKDAKGGHISLSKIWDEIQTGNRQGTARTFAKMESGANAITIYLGSRQSERFARIYDKAKEQGDNIGQWKRYELECKGMVSRALANILRVEPKWGAAFDAVALAMLDLPDCEDYQNFFTEGEAAVAFPKIERTSDREAWIAQQCIPAIVEHYQEHPESEAVRLLLESLQFVRTQRNRG